MLQYKIDWGDRCSTYCSTGLSGGTMVSWEANGALETDGDNEKTELWYLKLPQQHFWQLDCLIQLGFHCWRIKYRISRGCVCVWQWKVHTGFPLGPSSPGGPRAPAGPAAPGGPVSPFSPVSPLGPWGDMHDMLITTKTTFTLLLMTSC